METAGVNTNKSYFDGSLLSLLGWMILGSIVTGLTFGFGYPWALCKIYAWQIDHTVIEGKRLHFNGKAMSLLGNWIKWILLCIITFGIYGFWIFVKLEQWKTENTSFEKSV